jgi:hypothetical protein
VFYKNTGATSTRVVIRDASSEHAEACLHGLRLTMEWIREPTWVELDSSTLINDIVNRNDTRSSLLPACKFAHVRRVQ